MVLARHYLAGRAYATSINNDVCLHVTLMDCDHVAYSATKSDVIDRCLGDLHAKVDPDRSISHLALGYGKMLSFAYVRLVGASAELLVLKRGDVDRSFAIAGRISTSCYSNDHGRVRNNEERATANT